MVLDFLFTDNNMIVVYRVPAPDTCGSCTGSRYDWLTCGTPTELRIGPSRRKQSKWRRRSSD